MYPAAVRWKPLRTAGAAGLVAIFAVATPAFAVSVTVNGQVVTLSPAPIERAGRVFVPLRGVFERLGATVVYDNRTINATEGDRTVSLQIGSTQATVGGQTQTLDVAPFIVGASTYVPLRFVSQALGATVDWNGMTQTVVLTTSHDTVQAPAAPQDSGVPSYATVAVDQPPPALPSYAQPPCPQPNLVWTPGYWAWSPDGYYWVPGTWVAAPQPGYNWTPGYWAYDGGNYGWHPGYWGLLIGFYGGINYGFGYSGHGYDGGRWAGNDFQYNRSVSNVDTTVVKNTYVTSTVVNNYYYQAAAKPSYSGGPNGFEATPTPAERTAVRERRVPLTPEQVAHIRTAAQDRNLLATVNDGVPETPAVPRPFTPEHPPAHAEPLQQIDRTGGTGHVKSGSDAPETIDKLTPVRTPVTARPKAVVPTPRPALTEPAAQPPVHQPAPEPQVPKPTPEPQLPKPTPRPELPKVTPEPQSPKATPEPQSPKATAEPQSPKATPRPESPKPTARPPEPKETPVPETPKPRPTVRPTPEAPKPSPAPPKPSPAPPKPTPPKPTPAPPKPSPAPEKPKPTATPERPKPTETPEHPKASPTP